MGNNCNTTVITGALKGDKPHIIIDPGHIVNESGEDCLASLEAMMAADHIKIDETGLIINTHSHPDHCQSNELIVNRSGASVTLSKEEDDFRNTIGERMYTMFGMEAPRFTPLFFLKEGDADLGSDGFKVQVLLTPGHSPGSVCLYLPDTKILITGDVIFYMSVGRTDFPGGDTMMLKKSIEKLAGLDVEYLVPGHNTEPNGIIRGKDMIKRNFAAVQTFF
jgi:glyoxylase-like metal-dependent hydrolase (beta-lactamase superfamily II)